MKNIKNVSTVLFVMFLAPIIVWAQEQQELPVSTPEISVVATPEQSAQPIQQTQPESKSEKRQAPQINPAPQIPAQNEQDEEEWQEFVNPREIKDVLRQISQQKSEVKRLVKAAQKQKILEAVTELQSILSQIAQHEQAIRSEGDKLTRDILQEFYDEQIWESIEKIRYQVQLPQELKQIEKELRRVDLLLKQKATAAIPNLNLESIRARVAEIRVALEQAKSALASGDIDTLREAMEIFWQEGGHPGEIMGALTQLRDITQGLKRIKSAEVREAILDILSPVFESINDGDFREARMQLESIKQELMPLMQKSERVKGADKNLQQKIQQLEQKMENLPVNQKTKGGQSYVPYWYNQRASIFNIIRSRLGF